MLLSESFDNEVVADGVYDEIFAGIEAMLRSSHLQYMNGVLRKHDDIRRVR